MREHSECLAPAGAHQLVTCHLFDPGSMATLNELITAVTATDSAGYVFSIIAFALLIPDRIWNRGAKREEKKKRDSQIGRQVQAPPAACRCLTRCADVLTDELAGTTGRLQTGFESHRMRG